MNMIELMVQPFTGDDAYDLRKWMVDLEDAFLMLNLDERAKFVGTRRLMQGTAKVYARTITVHTYGELRSALMVEFSHEHTTDEIYYQLRSRRLRPSEGIHRYIIEMREIAAHGNIAESELVDIIIEGIGDSSSEALILYGANNIQELKMLVKRYERKIGLRSSARRMSTTTAPTSLHLPPAVRRTNTNINPSRAVTPLPSTSRSNGEAVRCYNWSRYGHYQSQCPRPRRPEGSCFRCGSMSHVYKNCPNKLARTAALTERRPSVHFDDDNSDDDETLCRKIRTFQLP